MFPHAEIEGASTRRSAAFLVRWRVLLYLALLLLAIALIRSERGSRNVSITPERAAATNTSR